jgi:hypothetical protein
MRRQLLWRDPRTVRNAPITAKEDIMLSYCFAWTPLVILMTLGLLALPWFGLIALMILSVIVAGTVAALAWTIVSVPRTLGPAIRQRWQARTVASRPAVTRVQPTRPVPARAAVLLANPRSEPHS